MKIGLVTKEFKNKDLAFNMKQIKDTATQYKNQNIDFLCFGEAFLQGFDAFKWEVEHDKQLAISKGSEFINELKLIAKSNQVGLGIGYLEEDNKVFYSSYIFIDDKGQEVYNYRRYTRGWKESYANKEVYQEGTEVGLFEYKSLKIAVGLCGDFWDERYDYVNKVSSVTKDVVIWPLYVNFSLADWEKEIVAYAQQSLLFGDQVLMINSITQEPRSFGGCFYFKNGHIQKKLPFDVEGVLLIEV